MPGPPPKPTSIRQLEGNRSHRPLNDAEPQPDSTMPDRPTGLTGDAKKAWERLAPQMNACGILTQLDRDSLESYCRLYAEARRCWREVKRTGGPVVSIAGKAERNPYLAEAHRLEQLLHKVRGELGLNATSRSRIRVAKSQEPEDIDEFLRFTG